MIAGANSLPPWVIALVVAGLAPLIARTVVDALVRRARARSASALRELERRFAQEVGGNVAKATSVVTSDMRPG